MNLKLLQFFHTGHPLNLKNYILFLTLSIRKFIPNLAQLCHPLRPLFRKSIRYTWTDEHTVHFKAIKTRIANYPENTHYNPQFETRIKSDASRSGLGAALEQLTVDGWKLISFAARFLNSNEERYGINEQE